MVRRSGGRFDMDEFGNGGRRLVLVDIENFLGRRYVTRSGARWVEAQLCSLLALRDDELVVVATSHSENLVACTTWKNVRHVCRSGSDGADLALLDVLDENIAARFTEVVVVSGDGIFAKSLGALAAKQVVTTVVARAETLSARLRLAAQRVIHPRAQFFGPVIEGMAA